MDTDNSAVKAWGGVQGGGSHWWGAGGGSDICNTFNYKNKFKKRNWAIVLGTIILP